MTKADQGKLRLLAGLLVVLAITVYFGYWVNRSPDPAVVEAQGQQAAAATATQNDAKIRIDLLDKRTDDQGLGKTNLFQYRTTAAPPAPPKPVVQASTPFTNPPPVQPPFPPNPRPAPPIPLRYIGFAFVEPNSKALIAALSDDTNRHFTVVEGEVLMGRYRILRISDTSVDVEDLEFNNRRQTLQLSK